MSVQTLIDRAGDRVGSKIKLAILLGVASSQVYDWRDGRKPCSPGDRARIAAFAGEDAVQELVRATLETAKGETRKKQLQQALGKLSQATGAVLGIVAVVLASLTFSPPAEAATSYDV